MRMKMMSKSMLFALIALSFLAACDSRTSGEFKAERANGLYQSAMADYTAGRLDAAAKGFEKALRADPGNASARFQLACLQQDSRHDYLGAYCSYREYLLIAPDSDKAKLAKERLAICEKMLVDEMVKKARDVGGPVTTAEVERLNAEILRLKDEGTKTAAALKDSNEKLGRLVGENARLRKLMASVSGEDEEPTKQADITSVKDLLDEDETEEGDAMATALDDAKALNALAEAEDTAFGSESSLLPQQAADAKDKKKAISDAEKKMKAARQMQKDAIPDTYVVQDGDTLYKIAMRFYGRTSAWKQIREANKATISTDGRVRTGMTIRLPK